MIQTFVALVIRIFFNITDPFAIKIPTKLRLDFSHLCEHKFRHSLKGTLKTLSPCIIEAETATLFPALPFL